MSYLQRLEESIENLNSRICQELGLSPDKMLPGYEYTPDGIVEMQKRIIDIGAGTISAYKITPDAFYTLGGDADRIIAQIVSYIRSNYPKKILIADIRVAGSPYTIQKYRNKYLEGPCKFDAVTMFPYPDELAIPYIIGPNWEHGVYLITGTEFHIYQAYRESAGMNNLGFAINGTMPNLYMTPTLRETELPTLIFNVIKQWYSDAALYGGGRLGLVNALGYVKANDIENWEDHLGNSYSESRYIINDNLRTRSRLAELVKALKESKEGSADGIIYDHYKKHVDREWGSWNYDGAEWTVKGRRSLFPPPEVLQMFGIKSEIVQLSTFPPHIIAIFIANIGANAEIREKIATGQIEYVNISALFDAASAAEFGHYLESLPFMLFRSVG